MRASCAVSPGDARLVVLHGDGRPARMGDAAVAGPRRVEELPLARRVGDRVLGSRVEARFALRDVAGWQVASARGTFAGVDAGEPFDPAGEPPGVDPAGERSTFGRRVEARVDVSTVGRSRRGRRGARSDSRARSSSIGTGWDKNGDRRCGRDCKAVETQRFSRSRDGCRGSSTCLRASQPRWGSGSPDGHRR